MLTTCLSTSKRVCEPPHLTDALMDAERSTISNAAGHFLAPPIVVSRTRAREV